MAIAYRYALTFMRLGMVQVSNFKYKKQAADKYNYERWLEKNARYEKQRPQRRVVSVGSLRKSGLLFAIAAGLGSCYAPPK